MTTSVQISLQVLALNSFGHSCRSRIFGSQGRSICNFVRNLHTVFHCGYTIYIPTNRAEGLQFPHIVPNICYMFYCLIVAILVGERLDITFFI